MVIDHIDYLVACRLRRVIYVLFNVLRRRWKGYR